MPARRDYAIAWRDSWVTLAQVPVAGLLAADYFYQQWVERSSTYLGHVALRLGLARPAGATAGEDDDVMADVLSHDVVEATRDFVRSMVSLPAESATFFSRRLEAMINELLMRIQPDAKFDPRTHVMNELDELNRELSRLREVIGAETTRQTVTDGPQQPEPPDEQRDHEALQKLRADLKAIAEGPPPGGSGSTARAVMLYVLQEVFNAALGRFDKTVARADAGHEARERTARLLLALQSFEANVEDARGKLYDEYQGVRTPRREAGRTRRLRR